MDDDSGRKHKKSKPKNAIPKKKILDIISKMCSNNVFAVNAGNASKNCAATSDLNEFMKEDTILAF